MQKSKWDFPVFFIILTVIFLVSACDLFNEDNGSSETPTNWDETFGTDGLTTTEFPDGQSQIQIILIDSQDRIYAIGWNYASTTQLAMARYSAEGILDTAFGTGGLVTDDFGGEGFEPADAVFDQNGKIVVSGFTGQDGTNPIVARYDSDGSLDTAFGTSGYYTLEFSGVLGTGGYTTERAFGLAVRASDNALYVNGTTNGDNSSSEYQSFVLALDTDGALLSPGWDSDGLAVNLLGSAGSEDLSFDLALDDAGQGTGNQPVLGGSAYNGSDYDFSLSNYTTTGSLDSSFGTNGKVTTDFGADDFLIKVHTYDNGRILAAGYTGSDGGYDIALARYSADGSLDSTFGSAGMATYSYSCEENFYNYRKSADAAVGDDGKIYFAGAGGSEHLTLVRFNADGSIDTSFGDQGESYVESSGGTIKALAFQSDGRIVAGGQVGYDNERDFHLVRFDP